MSEQRPVSHPGPEGSDRPAIPLPSLPGDRVVLRPWRAADREYLDFDDATRMYVGPSLPATDPEGFETWLARQRQARDERTALAWCIADPQTDRPWGWITLVELNELYQYGSAEVAYWVLEDARGKGALSEALQLVRDFAFSDAELALHRLFAITDHRNAGSQAVLRKAGFVWCGTERRAMVYEPQGPQYDVVRFELLAAGERGSAERPHRHVPNLTDGVIRLRPWRHADAQRVLEACSDETSQYWLAELPRPYTLADAEFYITASQQTPTDEGLPWCVAETESDECLGSIGVSHKGAAGGEIGYWTHPEVRGQGVIGRAMQLVLQHVLTSVEDGGAGLHRVLLRAAEANEASRSVARRAGFTEVGRDRDGLPLRDGTRTDAIRYDLLAREWHGSA